MQDHAREVARVCTSASDAEAISFPEVVAKLSQAGIERYHADLLRSEKIYFTAGGDSESTPCKPIGVPAAQHFSAEGVEAAVQAVQAGHIGYLEFCERIAKAGCVGYFVSLAGRRAVYYGRTGDCHVEWFPDSR